jgi:hypothetical protein
MYLLSIYIRYYVSIQIIEIQSLLHATPMLSLFQNGEIKPGHFFLPILLKILWDASGCLS